ncbi:unnamed protein product [Chondrus crispus]|uniref:protein phosphatase methylesterase-1 n=1 Tax=Chondrus crispus TaxID=2769 RepID=R7QBG9_CHOCR|nr:unnamed protein product [Chondrus crispus]CDF34766.1 unnamed protein product [Chondrus crispus]|eukprot:XP_005714585.1 unnamed protein product [Chondrus crispus]
MKPPSSAKPSTSMPPPPSLSRPTRFPDRAPTSPSASLPAIRRPSAGVLHSASPSPSASPAPTADDFSPRSWTDCFDHSLDLHVPSRNAVFRLYHASFTPSSDFCLLFLHGGGHSALSWALVADKLRKRCPVIAFDARGHGNSVADDDTDLSAETQVADAAELVRTFFKQRGTQVPRLVVIGHSMGGAIAARLTASKHLERIVGLVVIDVAVRYVTKAGHVRNTESARLSVPPQLVRATNKDRWTWRTDLEQSEGYWRGWFQGLSSLFLSVDVAKMLVLASVDRLDKHLMIAQMQGKFQNILIPTAGHAVHEDQPDQTAKVINDYLERNLFLGRLVEGEGERIFQQREPIPPCC